MEAQNTATLDIRGPKTKKAKRSHSSASDAESDAASSFADEPGSEGGEEEEQQQLGSMDGMDETDPDGAGVGRGRRKKPRTMDFNRFDKVWDNTIHNYRLKKSAEDPTLDVEDGGDLFDVCRTFGWEGKLEQTDVDIKSGTLREALQEAMGDVQTASLVGKPKIDPNLLFLYLQDMRAHIETLKHAKPTADTENARKKELERNETKRQQLQVLVRYLDTDYDAVQKRLDPLLANGLITFDLLWALWKPNTLVYTSTYGSHDQPHLFKAEFAEKHTDDVRGEYYYIQGKCLDYDGKRFGHGGIADSIDAFRGTRKITSLPLYPLQYHPNEAKLRRELIERGKKFVALSGVQYKSYDGMAYHKKKGTVVKVNITGRIMIDASTHRRTNPNYPLPTVVGPQGQAPEQGDDVLSDLEDEGDDGFGAGGGGGHAASRPLGGTEHPATLTSLLPDKAAAQGDGADGAYEADGAESGKATALPEFSDEEYLIASPIVLGFAFAEKLWLELGVSNVKDIQWSEDAYDSLVLEPKTKDIVKALVESYKYHPAESIDDVIQGKGKGLVAVLHGPPGTGKTLTVEGISELLRCPLYIVSAGELGTSARLLETELQKIMDICHTWGAILLLDEADVFLEKRNMQDIHRNALVSIFLRQLEYFQGILFLTTNRVETFDDAFQSRVHMALRYDSLDQSARKAVFKIFIERVRVLAKIDRMPFSEDDYGALARHELNGRQIKNTVRTAQALAVNRGEPLSMAHIRQVLDVQMSFARDLKGGPGFQDAMRSYF